MMEAFRSGFSIHTSRLINALELGRIGDTLTREQLTEIAGVDVSPDCTGYAYIQSAIRFCERHGKIWRWSKADSVYRCLDAIDAAHLIQSRAITAHRHAGRSLRIAASVDRDQIKSIDEQRAFDASVLQLAMARQSLGANMRKKLEARSDIEKLTAPSPEALVNLMK